MAKFPCSNLLSDGKIQDLGSFYLKWTSWSSLLQQQQWGLSLISTHSQALGTAARYQRLRHPCAAHIHSCCSYCLCCSEISDSMRERVVVSIRIYLVLAHICLMCYLDYYAEWLRLARTPGGDQLQPQLKQILVAQVAHTAFEMSARVESPQPHWAPCSSAQSLDKEVSPSIHLCRLLLLLRCRTLHSMRFLSAHFPSHTVLLYMK